MRAVVTRVRSASVSIDGAVAGQMTVDQALAAGQAVADRAVRQAGYRT